MRYLMMLAIVAAPLDAAAETCSLYQKWKKDNGEGNCSAFPDSSYFEVTPVLGDAASTYFARKIPKCKDGTDSCAGYEVRSLDGTRAFYYVDPANTGVEISKKWIIAFEGGGSCGAMRGDNAPTACMNGTQDPADNYAFNGYDVFTGDPDYKEMTTRHADDGLYTIPDRRIGRGILAPSAPNQFASYHRVIVNKSSFDRFMGNADLTAPYNTDDVRLHFHGRRLISSTLKDLARSNGAFSVGRNCPNFLETECQTVADFAQATHVVVVGLSGGAGGIIHNMEWLKSAILNRAPNAKVGFLLASRMMPWLEAEVHWSGGFSGIWDDVYSGLSTINGDPGGPTPNAVTQYSNDAYEPGGIIRGMLASWGNPGSAADPFLDASCIVAHGAGHWKCFDEGHVALNHMDEDVFWFESILDGVHNQKSPAPWIDLADFGNGAVDLGNDGGFIWDPSGSWEFRFARGDRVIYTADEMLLAHPGTGVLGFYMPGHNCHTTIFSSAWSSDKLMLNGTNITSLQDAFVGWWNALASGAPVTRAWINDSQSNHSVSWASGIYGGGWTANSNNCPN